MDVGRAVEGGRAMSPGDQEVPVRKRAIRRVVATVLISAVVLPATATAQQMFIYPDRGQSPQQQQKDRGECHVWAVQQTGVDPTMTAAAAPPPPPSMAPQGQAVRGAARGAALGAVGGAIMGNAGKGAAAGAAMGGLFGAMRRHDEMVHEQQAYSSQAAQQQAAQAQASATYNRALGACLSGRGYTVR